MIRPYQASDRPWAEPMMDEEFGAFGTSARSVVLMDWPDGGFVGIHETHQPELLPGRVSHGCMCGERPQLVGR